MIQYALFYKYFISYFIEIEPIFKNRKKTSPHTFLTNYVSFSEIAWQICQILQKVYFLDQIHQKELNLSLI